jgi:hypothetical protein
MAPLSVDWQSCPAGPNISALFWHKKDRAMTQHSASKGDWRISTLAKIRTLIKQAAPDAVEEMKWKKPSNPAGVPLWSLHGMICTGETYKDKVKLTFAYGASLADPHGLFNGNDKGQTRRSIDLREDHPLDEKAFTALVHAAVAHNQGKAKG